MSRLPKCGAGRSHAGRHSVRSHGAGYCCRSAHASLLGQYRLGHRFGQVLSFPRSHKTNIKTGSLSNHDRLIQIGLPYDSPVVLPTTTYALWHTNRAVTPAINVISPAHLLPKLPNDLRKTHPSKSQRSFNIRHQKWTSDLSKRCDLYPINCRSLNYTLHCVTCPSLLTFGLTQTHSEALCTFNTPAFVLYLASITKPGWKLCTLSRSIRTS